MLLVDRLFKLANEVLMFHRPLRAKPGNTGKLAMYSLMDLLQWTVASGYYG
jgi:hypothetical protein